MKVLLSSHEFKQVAALVSLLVQIDKRINANKRKPKKQKPKDIEGPQYGEPLFLDFTFFFGSPML